ncbi:hypothetical protein DIPPA_29660 [Diplonema papillatum]|nr:hypothetical protein DIPPA_29660 [Diplonema papillatum]
MREVAVCANVVPEAGGGQYPGGVQPAAGGRGPAVAATLAAMERMKRDPTIAFVRCVRSMERGHEQAVADAGGSADKRCKAVRFL